MKTKGSSPKKIFNLPALLLLLGIGFVQPIFGWYEEFRQSVRGRAMANTLGTSFSGIEGMYYNPATIAKSNQFEFMSSFAEPAGGFSAFDDGSSLVMFETAMVFPFANPVNLKRMGWDSDFITTKSALGISFIQQGYDSGDGMAGVAQRYVGVSYAKDLDNALFQGARLSVGITANIYMLSFTGTDVGNNAAFANVSATAFSPDLGVLYNFSDFILLSLVIENLIPATISPFSNGETLATNTKLGLSWNMGSIMPLPFLQDVLLSGEWRMQGAADQGENATTSIASLNSYHVAWESWYKVKDVMDMAFRLGLGVGERSFSEMAMGLGFGRFLDSQKRYKIDVHFSWVWSSFINSLGSDMRYYVGGAFKYIFDAGSLPGRETSKKIPEKLTKEVEEPPKK